jgi:hypothetical protein
MIQFGDPGNDFIREVKPNKRQEDFLSIPDEVFEALYGGAAYGGKSFILTLLPLIRGFYKYRGFKGIILRRKFPDLEREIIRLSKDYYPLTGAKYNETKHSWEWPEYGSYMDFGHVQHASDIRQYDSAQYNYCAFDELTHFEEAPYVYMVGSRVRPGSSFNLSFVRNGTNPGGVGQTFVYNRFVRPCEEGYKLIRDTRTYNEPTGRYLYRIFIPAFPQDNIHGMEYDPQYLQKLELLPENEKRAKKYGDWHAFEGSVFPEFRPIKFPNEPNNALHVIEPFDVPSWWPKILSIDWGKRAMCHAMWAAISPNNRVYIYRERYWIGKDVPFWASEVGETSQHENIVHFILCGSAWQERGVETIAEQVQRYSGLTPSSSDNSPGSRVAGLQSIHDFMRWESKTLLKSEGEFYDLEYSQMLFRNYGENAVKEYKARFFDEEDEANLPRLQIFENCKVLIETIPMCIHDEKKIEDIAEFSGDDPIDNLRYLCKAVNRFCNGPDSEMEKRIKINSAIASLQNNNDQTAFYRKMEHLEVSKPLGVVRKSFWRRRNASIY